MWFGGSASGFAFHFSSKAFLTFVWSKFIGFWLPKIPFISPVTRLSHFSRLTFLANKSWKGTWEGIGVLFRVFAHQITIVTQTGWAGRSRAIGDVLAHFLLWMLRQIQPSDQPNLRRTRPPCQVRKWVVFCRLLHTRITLFRQFQFKEKHCNGSVPWLLNGVGGGDRPDTRNSNTVEKSKKKRKNCPIQ